MGLACFWTNPHYKNVTYLLRGKMHFWCPFYTRLPNMLLRLPSLSFHVVFSSYRTTPSYYQTLTETSPGSLRCLFGGGPLYVWNLLFSSQNTIFWPKWTHGSLICSTPSFLYLSCCFFASETALLGSALNWGRSLETIRVEPLPSDVYFEKRSYKIWTTFIWRFYSQNSTFGPKLGVGSHAFA